MNRHARRRMEHAIKNQKTPKTSNTQTFENELRANIEKSRPGLRFCSLKKLEDGSAWVTLHDGKFKPLRVRSPVGLASGPYTELVLQAYDAQLIADEIVERAKA